VKRELAQTRTITCTGYKRADGFFDIEAHLVDTKPFAVDQPRFGAPKPAGHPLHEMKIRVTIDGEMSIHEAEAATIHAPFEPCAVPPTVFPKLKGFSFKKGWKQEVARIMGGTRGCTHLRELLGVLATVAYQTVVSTDEYFARFEDGKIRPFFIGTCHTYEESGPVIKRLYPNFYIPKNDEAGEEP
jgi:hypothetical protein